MNIQRTGDFHGEDFATIYITLLPKVQKNTHSFLQKPAYRNLSLDPADLTSYAMNENLKKRIKIFNGQGTFEGFFFRYLSNAFVDAVRPSFAKKRQINTFPADSMDREIDEDGSVFGDQFAVIDDNVKEISEEMMELINFYTEKKGEDVKKLLLAMGFLKGEQRTQAICRIYGVETYNSTIRKRVSRLQKDFGEFLITKGVNVR